MTAPTPPPGGPPLFAEPYYDPRRWLYAGLVALFALLGVSILIAVAVPVIRGEVPAWQISEAPWDWLLGLLGVVIAIWIAVAIVRVVAWGVLGPGYAYRHDRRAWRHYYRHWGGPFDDAVATARERYARGEISRDQLDQIVHDLSRPPAYPPGV